MKKIQQISISLNSIFLSNTFTENVEVLRIFKFHLYKDQHEILLGICKGVQSCEGFSVQLTSDVGDEISIEEDFIQYENSEIDIKITKPIGIEVYFFSEKGINTYLEQPDALKNIETVYILFLNNPFESYSVVFGNESVQKQESSLKEKIHIIKYVKPLNTEAQSFLPEDISQWITKSPIDRIPLKSWIATSTKKILCSIAMELTIHEKKVTLQILGDRRKRINFDLDSSPPPQLIYILNQIAFWIYLEGRDIDSRHNIINFELCKLIPEDLELSTDCNIDVLFKNAFENGKLVYRYHLINSSKDLNKTLVDLNKSLFEYTSKIRQNTIDLINTLWRDFTTAFGVLVLNYALKKPDLGIDYFKYLGLALCVYLLVSFALSAKVNFWYYKSLKQSLKEWRPKIYGYLSDSDFEEYTYRPLRKAQGKYKSTFVFVMILYIVMIFAVGTFLLKKETLLEMQNFKAAFVMAYPF